MTTTGKVLIAVLGVSAVGGAAYYFLSRRQGTPVPGALPAGGSAAAPQPSAATGTSAPAPQSGAVAAADRQASPYEGKVIRADMEPAVYWVINGVRHGFLSPAALARSGFTFAQVQSVPKAIVMAIPEGTHISGINTLGALPKRLLY